MNVDLVGVQEVRWDKVDTVRAGDYIFFCGMDEACNTHGGEEMCIQDCGGET